MRACIVGYRSGPVVQMLGPALSGVLYGTLVPSLPALAPSLLGALLAIASLLATHAVVCHITHQSRPLLARMPSWWPI